MRAVRDVAQWVLFAGGMLGLVAAAIGLVGAFHLYKLKAGSPTFEADIETQDRLLNAAMAFLIPSGALVVFAALVALVARGAAVLS
jgi:hypothetical protein